MFIRAKLRKGRPLYYLVENCRANGKVRQKVLCYLGAFSDVEECYVNARGKQRVKLARYRDPADRMADQISREQEREYKLARRIAAPTYAVRVMLPGWSGCPS